jgi:hypothetical protein
MSFIITAGPRQRSYSQVRVRWDSWSHFTVSDSRFPQPGCQSPYLYPPGRGRPGYNPRDWVTFSLLPTTRRVTAEVFDPASTLDHLSVFNVCEDRTLSVTNTRFFFPPGHLGVLEMRSPLRQEGSAFRRRESEQSTGEAQLGRVVRGPTEVSDSSQRQAGVYSKEVVRSFKFSRVIRQHG